MYYDICIYIYIIGLAHSFLFYTVVICMVLYTMSLYNTSPIRCTPLPLHPPVMNIQSDGANSEIYKHLV